MAREKRASWWKMFAHQRAVIESAPSVDVGDGLKAAFAYFDGEDIGNAKLSQSAFMVFCAIRPYLDEAKEDYEASVENGKRGAAIKNGRK